MSLYQFMACDFELPELISYRKRQQDGIIKKVIYNETDFTDLEILKCTIEKIYKDIPYYTDCKNVYAIDWDYSDNNCKKLFDYIKTNYNGKILEIWSIWLCDYKEIENEIQIEMKKIKTNNCSFSNLTIDVLRASVKCENSGDTPNVLIIN